MHDDEPPFDDEPHNNVYDLPTPQPHHQAEQAVLGAILYNPDTYDHISTIVDADDFDDINHELIYQAMADAAQREGHPPDHVLIRAQLARTNNLRRVLPTLLNLTGIDACPNPAAAPTYAREVAQAALTRRLQHRLNALQARITTTPPDNTRQLFWDTLDELQQAGEELEGIGRGRINPIPTLDELLAGDEPEYDWVIPQLLEHQERVILTAEPGAGKSTLLRQFAICATSGIHPFTAEAITPIRVLHVDVENSVKQSRRQYRPLRVQAGTKHHPDNLHIEIRIQGLDLTQAADQQWLNTAVKTTQPDLLLIGPIYKLANGDPTEEKSAKPVAMALDQIRAEHRCAILLEAHPAKAPVTGAKNRKPPMEPYGWSGWMRWPEIGIFLTKDGTLKHWRGAREERSWPTSMKRGGAWPWTPELTETDHRWIAMQKARRDAGQPIGLDKLSAATGIPKSTLADLTRNGGRYGHAWAGYNHSQHPGDGKRQEDE